LATGSIKKCRTRTS